MTDKAAKSGRRERVREELKRMGAGDIVERTRDRIVITRTQGKRPWELDRTDTQELLKGSSSSSF